MDAYTKVKDQGQEKIRVVEDRISNLPDEVLIHILSFLLTNEAVSTSTLSKRWNTLWTFLPTLSATNFKHGIDKNEDNLLDFVDKVLIGHKMPFLEKIYISCRYLSNSRITSWISAAVKLDVRCLKLNSEGLQLPDCHLPSCLFTMNKIVTLHLVFPMCLSFPLATDCFPNLKELILGSLIYEDDESVQNLISGCPVLERLYLNREGFDGLENFTVSSRSLKRLAFNVFISGAEEEDRISKITIDCPSVEYLHIDDNITEEFIVRDLSSVVNARLDLAYYRYEFHELDTYARHVFELLTTISNVKTLAVSDSTMKTMSAADGEILPTFHNLKHLEFFSIGEGNWNMAAIIEFLKSTPVLEVLVFEGFTFSDEEFHSFSADVPNCLISHLKTIEINGYLGSKDQQKVHYFLENSKVLENWIFKQRGAAFMECIQRGSSACKVSVSTSK